MGQAGETGTYTGEEWRNLTDAQREEVKRLRSQQHQKRSVSFVQGDVSSEVIIPSKDMNAGDQFAHSNKKPKST